MKKPILLIPKQMKQLLLPLLLIANITSFGQCVVADYQFDGNAADSSGNGNDGTVIGATLTTDRFGNANSAYSFDGVDDYINVSNVILPNTPTSHTISLWVQADSLFSWAGLIGDKGNPNCGYKYAFAIETATGLVGCASHITGPWTVCDTRSDSNSFQLNTWYHLAATYNVGTNTQVLYMNGVPVDTTSCSIYNTIGNATTIGAFLACGGGISNYHNGKLDDIKIFDCALLNDQVDSIYMAESSQDTCTFTDTTYVTVYDTTEVFDTTYVTVNDTVTYYDTVLVSVTDTLIIDVTLTGVAPPNNMNTVKVYPNPAKDQLYIDNGDYLSMSGYTLKIVNSVGQDVFSALITTPLFVIDISTLGSTGLYYIQVIDGSSNVLENKKLVLN